MNSPFKDQHEEELERIAMQKEEVDEVDIISDVDEPEGA